MHKIDVDDEVFAFLQREAEPFVDTPNDVLRRKLLNGSANSDRPMRRRGTGDLLPLIQKGRINPGDELIYHQPRKHRTHHARVLPDGWIDVDGTPYKHASPSLRACVGTEINGWLWVHTASGQQLRALRDESAA